MFHQMCMHHKYPEVVPYPSPPSLPTDLEAGSEGPMRDSDFLLRCAKRLTSKSPSLASLA